MKPLFLCLSLTLAQVGFSNAFDYTQIRRVNCIELDDQQVEKLLEDLNNSPPEALYISNIEPSDFDVFFENVLKHIYSYVLKATNNNNSYFLFNPQPGDMSAFQLANPLEYPQDLSYIYDDTPYQFYNCAEGSAAVTSRIDSNGNKQVNLDLKTRSNDGRFEVTTSGGVQQSPGGKTSVSGEVKAQMNFGGSKQHEKK